MRLCKLNKLCSVLELFVLNSLELQVDSQIGLLSEEISVGFARICNLLVAWVECKQAASNIYLSTQVRGCDNYKAYLW